MTFEQLLIQITEIIHKSVQNYKEELIRKSKFKDITLKQLFYLEAIYHLENPTIGGLASHLKVTNASTSNAVKKLISNGLVIKEISSSDQRSFNVSLSKKGLELIVAEEKAVKDFIAGIKNSISEKEMEVLIKIFQKVIYNYNKSSGLNV